MTHETLAAALSAAQGEFNAVPKGGTNPHFRSKFPELADAVKTAAPVLAKHGLAVTQPVDFDDHLRHYLTTILMHASGQELRSRMLLKPVKEDPQSLGSAITYARRYSYMAILGLAPDDDDGQAASSPTQIVPAPEQHKPDAVKRRQESTAAQESALIPSAKAKQHLLDHLEATGLDPLRSREIAVQLWDEAHLTSAPITEDTLQTLYGWADGIAAE